MVCLGLATNSLLRAWGGRYSKCPHCDQMELGISTLRSILRRQSDDDPVLIPFCIGMADKAMVGRSVLV